MTGHCDVTSNPCGTDTWAEGHPCQCAPCREYVDRYRYHTDGDVLGEMNRAANELVEHKPPKTITVMVPLEDLGLLSPELLWDVQPRGLNR